MAKRSSKPRAKADDPLRLDLGCGPNKKEGFVGVDIEPFAGVDEIHDLRKTPWPWGKDSVDEVNCSHFLEHLTGPERVAFFNELYRVMKVEGKATFITPHWGSGRAYGDPTHQWPPVVEFFWYYLNREWRGANAPHVSLTCNFEVSWGHSIIPEFAARSQETQMFGINHYREVAQDMIATATKKA